MLQRVRRDAFRSNTHAAVCSRATDDRIGPARPRHPRSNSFHTERRLPADERAELADYKDSGFDRGHLAPSADMPDAAAEAESFSLANVAPQVQGLNRGLWAGIEAAVLGEAARRGTLFVVTGPAFATPELASVGHVMVPTHFWKAIYDPARHQAGAYLVENTDDAAWRQVSLVNLTALTGIDPFPRMFARAMRLPSPRAYR